MNQWLLFTLILILGIAVLITIAECVKVVVKSKEDTK